MCHMQDSSLPGVSALLSYTFSKPLIVIPLNTLEPSVKPKIVRVQISETTGDKKHSSSKTSFTGPNPTGEIRKRNQ